MIKLFVSTFGNSVEKIKKECIPIEVGSANRNNFLYDLHDDSGDTISKDNPYWGELTGLYWIWKNYQFEENDIVGFCHYNKFLKITDVKINSFLSENDSSWVVLSRVRMPDHSYPEDIDVLTSVLQKKYPDYYANWSLLYNCIGGGLAANCSNCELFYTSVFEFNKYCEFLFGVLTEVYNKIGKVSRSKSDTRYLAFLGERLLSVYLLTHNCKFLEAEMKIIPQGMYDRLRIALKAIARFFHISKNSKLYDFFSKNIKHNSSYTKK